MTSSRRALLASAVIVSCMAGLSPVAAGRDRASTANDWRNERWVVESFTGALGGGPAWGPVAETGAGGGSSALCGDRAGNIYFCHGNRIDIITKDGMRHHLAGNGRKGYRDGPAELAEFRIGVRAFYGWYNINCDDRGNVYVPDNGNSCVRRVFKDAKGKWMVETYAGGGGKTLSKGQSCSPREAKISGTLIVAAAPNGLLYIATTSRGYQVTPDGKTLKCLGGWPASTARRKDRPPYLTFRGGGDCDRAGNAYFTAASPMAVVKITPEGDITHIAFECGVDIRKRGDAPPMLAGFNTSACRGSASPDGSCIYVSGGDEYDIRRVPTDLKTTTATLLMNGRWYVMKVHPNANRGRAVFDASATGKPRTEGGRLHNLAINPILGRDYSGNLYGALAHWVGRTQEVKGKGLLGTRVFRIRKLGQGEDE